MTNMTVPVAIRVSIVQPLQKIVRIYYLTPNWASIPSAVIVSSGGHRIAALLIRISRPPVPQILLISVALWRTLFWLLRSKWTNCELHSVGSGILEAVRPARSSRAGDATAMAVAIAAPIDPAEGPVMRTATMSVEWAVWFDIYESPDQFSQWDGGQRS